MVYTPPQLLSFAAFLERYGDQPRYELADGELLDMGPSGPHEAVAGKLASESCKMSCLGLNHWSGPPNESLTNEMC